MVCIIIMWNWKAIYRITVYSYTSTCTLENTYGALFKGNVFCVSQNFKSFSFIEYTSILKNQGFSSRVGTIVDRFKKVLKQAGCGTTQAQRRTCSHELICLRYGSCQLQGHCAYFTCEYFLVRNGEYSWVEYSRYHTPLIGDYPIVSKLTRMSECDVALGRYYTKPQQNN